MQKKRTKYSVCKVIDKDTGRIVGYLTQSHIEWGLDIRLDMAGYTIISL